MAAAPTDLASEDYESVTEDIPQEAAAWPPTKRLRGLERVVEFALVILFSVNLALVVVVTILRYAFNTGVPWSLEISQLLLAGLVFMGSAVALNRGEHRSLRLIVDLLPERVRRANDSFLIMSIGVFSGVLVYGGVLWFANESGFLLGSSIPTWVATIPIIAGSALTMIYCVALLMDRDAVSNIWGAVVTAVLIGAIYMGTIAFPGPRYIAGAVGAALILLLVLLLVGMPIAFVFGISTAAVVFASQGLVPVESVVRRATENAGSFVLAAVPFFIAAGLMMEAGDITRRIIATARAFIGHFRGGVAQVMIGSMYFMSGVSGSEAADVAAVGTIMRRPMRQAGYTPGEATGIMVAACVMGATVPPSIGLIVIAASTELSVGTLFFAGFLPAAALALILVVTVYLRARSKGISGEPRQGWGDRARAIKGAAFAFGLPIIVLGGLLGGFGTPTELSAFAVVYVLIVELLVHRKLRFKELWRVIVDTGVLTGMILFIVAMASALVYLATLARIPQSIGSALVSIGGTSQTAFLILTILALIPLGMLMEGIAALLVFPALLMPTAIMLGVNPIHYAICMFIAIYIGANAPPLGAGFYFASAVLRSPIKAAVVPTFAFLGIVTVGLFVLVFFPQITLIVPQMLGMID
jgi:tripartite ATP-independent transporter DctM subunit